MNYDILSSETIEDLVDQVREHTGWKPQGGVSSDRGRMYYQAIVPREKDDAMLPLPLTLDT